MKRLLTSRAMTALALPILLATGILIFASLSTNIFIASPAEVWQRFVQWWPVGWHTDLLPSLRNVLVGFLLASIAGIGLGILLGTSRVLRELCTPMIDFIRAVPDAAVVPCLLLIFGFEPGTRVLVVFLSSIWPILIGTIDGVLAIDPRQREMARAFRVPPVRRFFRLLLPAASPQILSGIKVGLTVAIVVVVISEMFGSTEGLGYFIIASQRQFDVAGVWLGTIIIALIGYLLNTGFGSLQQRLLRWHPSYRDAR